MDPRNKMHCKPCEWCGDSRRSDADTCITCLRTREAAREQLNGYLASKGLPTLATFPR